MEHSRYLVELSRASILDNEFSPYDDNVGGPSELLRERKQGRRAQHGPIERIWGHPSTRPLAELSPGLRALVHVKEGNQSSDAEARRELASMFGKRTRRELEAHEAEILRLSIAENSADILCSPRDRVFALMLDTLQPFGFESRSLPHISSLPGQASAGSVLAKRWPSGLSFAVVPVFSAGTEALADGATGSFACGFRLFADVEDSFQGGVRVENVAIDTLLPGRFVDYRRWSTSQECWLVALAWRQVLATVVADVVLAVSAAVLARAATSVVPEAPACPN